MNAIVHDCLKRGEVSVLYKINDTTRVSGVCEGKLAAEMPRICVGVMSTIGETTDVRAKVTSEGVLSGCFRSTLEKKIALNGSLSVDLKNLNGGNHKVGFGMEFLF